MQRRVKHNVLGVQISEVEYDDAVGRIVDAAQRGQNFTVSALAVHGVMTGVLDRTHRQRLNHLSMVTADGQPVRWALRLLHGVNLADRVAGPSLTLKVCEAAAREGLPVFFYGSRQDVLDRLVANLQDRYPGLIVAGSEPSKFRTITPDEKEEIAERIRASGAKIVMVGLGCPRQEVFVYEFRNMLRMPVLAVGAAFDFHAGLKQRPPEFIQRAGLEWLYRLMQDPVRLWKRYALLNPLFLFLLAMQMIGFWQPNTSTAINAPMTEELVA